MNEIKIEIFGRVQGVRFRQFVKDTADSLQLKGYVMNRFDGSVLVIAQGTKEKLEQLIAIVQKGSLLAKVEGVSYYWRKKTKKFNDFEIVVDNGFIADQKLSLLNLGKKLLHLDNRYPQHVSIIPDGNRRWAKSKGFDEIEGHKKAGAYENMKALLAEAKNLNIRYLTFWGFSTENWKRSKKEVESLFSIMNGLLEKIGEDLVAQKIRFRHLGRKDRLPRKLVEVIEDLEERTKSFSDFNLQICLDYGGRDEIVRALNKVLKAGVSEIAEDDLVNYLDSAGIPDPDLIIRTSGEYRMSGFMPFQSAYSEFYFTDVHFPDFGPQQLREAVEEFAQRKRRFGGS